MPTIVIDGREVTVPEGGTVLDAARKLGIEIPTMCHLEGSEPSCSCLMCIVRVNGSDRLVPSCATRAEEGMRVESETATVIEARKMALELLLGDHLGECLAPCHRICPLDLDIPRMTRQVKAGELVEAIIDVRRVNPFPGILGRVCAAKCEVGCRRRDVDGAVAIRSIERQVADADRESDQPYVPPVKSATGKRVAVVGGGPAGLSAAYFLKLAGHQVTVFERREQIGGRLRHAHDREVLPEEVLDAEIEIVSRLGVLIRVGVEVDLAELRGDFDAVLLAASGVAGETAGAGLFKAGDAVRRIDDPARAMASGKEAALAIDAFFNGREWAGPMREFSTVVGKLTAPELELYAREGPGPEESARCMRCDCRATATCLLKHYAEVLGANPNRFKSKRRLFLQSRNHPFVIYEPGKCIACGICVTICREMGEELGLTFIGRGFDVRVGVPFDAPLTEALRQAAKRCVEECPTGALAVRDEGGGGQLEGGAGA
jgi:glutamate synthase (NADPH) small chain